MQEDMLSQRDAGPENVLHAGEEYAPLGEAYSANPYRMYARMRERPVFYNPSIRCWVVSRYEDVANVLKDYQRFAPAVHLVGASTYLPEVANLMRTRPDAGIPSLAIVDPPEHTRLRNAVNKAMSAQRIASLEPRMRQFANRLIDEFPSGVPFDFVKRFARPFPVLVITSLFNVPEADIPQLHRWVDNMMDLLFAQPPAEQQLPLAQSYVAVTDYVYDLVQARQKAPQDDLASDLLRAIDTGEVPLSVLEATNLIYVLLAAGFESTVNFLGNCLLQLLSERAYWQSIQDNPQEIPPIIEESLRFNSPAISTFRQAKEAVEVGGKLIPKGALVQVIESSANHDEAVFAHPESFDPQREKLNRHLAFGYGIHFCIGAPLVRLEMRIALEQLSQRLPSLRLVPYQEISYLPSLTIHGMKQLLVESDKVLEGASV